MATDSTEKGLEVIGAGFGRTGTVSLKKALEILGYDPCYHMHDLMTTYGHVSFWIRLANGDKVNFKDIFEKKGYKASVDTPCSSFWREQLEQYPGAKVVLTVRDPEKWFKSWNDTIYSVISDSPNGTLLANIALLFLNMRPFHKLVIEKRIFKGSYSKENTIKCFNEHNEQVKKECPKDKLLVFEVSQGWEPLCKFLGKPVPDVPFPHLNDSNEFKKAVLVINIIGGVIVTAGTLTMLGGLYYLSRECSGLRDGSACFSKAK